VITITDLKLGKEPLMQEIEKVLRNIEHFHQGSIARYRILYRDANGLGGELKWDGRRA